MKKISKIILFLFISSFTLVGCSDLLDVDSNRLVFPNEYNINASNDTLYSMFAIFSQVEKLADSYVLLGELRGDLMTVTDKSSKYLKEINNFEIPSNDNPFTNNIKDYYSVINNCNYVIHNIDTSKVTAGIKVMYKEYAACKAIRAWTYMQIVFNYGNAIYYDKPILSQKDAKDVQNQTPINLAELTPILIDDLKPWKDVDIPSLGSLFTHNISNSFFPIRFLLGDLYLWSGQYEAAANEYHDLMFKNRYTINNNATLSNGSVLINRTTWDVITNATTQNVSFTGKLYRDQICYYIVQTSENITNIAATNQYGTKFHLDSLTLNRMIVPSDVAINNWQKQMYFYSQTLDTVGDLRIKSSAIALSDPTLTYLSLPNSNILSEKITSTSYNYIYKYILLNIPTNTKKTDKQITPYRVPLLYLRYAEAVNRLGKPNLAFAVLKNGLNSVNMQDSTIIPKNELSDPLPNYMNFSDTRFSSNIGIRMRGCGNVNTDTVNYIIPTQDNLSNILHTDSITYVEDMIEQELALETAFEGNRFQDLMRIAIRRKDTDPAYLANKIAAKHTITVDLTNSANWYIKK
ncbi:MAG: RagB/SusD family nutrient uptake outer membrane protein [Paludibacter sp.]|nr:RagB/SusD family nutrient uptake outer membrane protein [Paludibacter sp.]